jgi:hypothetical protein
VNWISKKPFLKMRLTIENINTLKKQVYTTKENYENLEKNSKRSDLPIKNANDTEAKENTLILGICLWIAGEQEEAIEILTEQSPVRLHVTFLVNAIKNLKIMKRQSITSNGQNDQTQKSLRY